MAQLDVNLLLEDPMFLDTFDVLRREEQIGEDGRAASQDPTHYPGIVGSVQYESASETQKGEAGQYSPRNLKIWTAFRLVKASEGFSPDQILWNDELFEILDVQSYANAGRGFYIGVARSIKVLNQP